MIREEQNYYVKKEEKKSKIPDFLMYLYILAFVLTILSMCISGLNQKKEDTIEKLNKNYKEMILTKEYEPLILKSLKLKNVSEEDIMIFLSNQVYSIFYVNKNNKLKEHFTKQTSDIINEKTKMKLEDLNYLVYYNKKWYVKNEIQKKFFKQEIEEIIKCFITDFNREGNIEKSWDKKEIE